MRRQNKDLASGAQLCGKGLEFSMTWTVSSFHSINFLVSNLLLTFGPECAAKALSLSPRMRTPRTKPVWSCGPAPFQDSVSLQAGPMGPCRLLLLSPPLFCPRISEKPNLLGSALRPLLSSPTYQPTPFQGIRDLFYLQILKKLVAKVTGAGTAGSSPWGRGFAPKQLSVGAVPAGSTAFACSGST